MVRGRLGPPLAFSADEPGVERYQIVQIAPATVRVRLRMPIRTRSGAVHDQVARKLAVRGLGHVMVELGGEPPEQSPGGTFREVIPLGR